MKNLLIQRIFILILIVLPSSQYAQLVTGVVRDYNTGEALIGAALQIGDVGGVTDIDGSFSLDKPNSENLLTVSYIGYVSQTLDLNSFSNLQDLNIQLELTTNVLETATITGSRYEKSVAKSAVSINVLKPRLVENTNASRLNAVLDKIPGVQIIDNQANIRGGSGWSFGAGSRVLLLIDDIPALQGDAGRPSWGDIPVENISQVEVLKGASSTLYGSSAMNGIINVRTGYATTEPTTKASVSYTHFMDPSDAQKKWWDTAPNKIFGSLLHKQKFGKLDLVANAFYENLDSYYENGYDRKYRLSANLKYRINDRVTAGLNTLLNIGENANPFIWENGAAGAYRALPGSLIAGDNKRYYIDPQITIFDKKDNRHKIQGRYYYIENNNTNNQSNSSTSQYLEYQFLKLFKESNLNLTSGASAYFVNSNSELFGDVELTSNNLALFSELNKDFGDKLTATFGLRYEYNYQESPEVFKGDTIPGGLVDESQLIARMGLNYQMAEGTFLRASWGQGYRFPTITERFIETAVSGFFIFPNVDLESEKGWTAELGLKQGVLLGEWKGYIDVAAFWSQYDNMTEFTFVSFGAKQGFQSQNVGATDIKGYEINLIGNSSLFGMPFNVLAGYTYIDPIYRNFDDNEQIRTSISTPIGESEKQNVLKYRSRHNFKIDAESQVNALTIGASLNYTSTTVAIDQLLNNIGFIEFYREANPGGFLKLDSRISYNFNFAKVSLLGENLLNKEITYRPGLLEAPRNLSLRLEFNL